MTAKEWVDQSQTNGPVLTMLEEAHRAGQEAMRDRAVLWAVEYMARMLVNRLEWPLSSKAGFPHIKAQALIDAGRELPVE